MPSPVTEQITAFEVAPESDDAFLAAAVRPGATLHRALRRDVAFRFVEVAPAGAPPPDVPFRAHPGAYEVVREDGTPDIEGGVALIELFDVHDDDRFLDSWDRARETVARQRGYIGARLHSAVAPADFRFVAVARWSSPLMYARALARPEFAQAMPFGSHQALYLVVGD